MEIIMRKSHTRLLSSLLRKSCMCHQSVGCYKSTLVQALNKASASAPSPSHSTKTAKVLDEFAVAMKDGDKEVNVDGRPTFAYFLSEATTKLISEVGVGKHPGRRKLATISLPDELMSARRSIIQAAGQSKDLHEEALKLKRKIRERLLPLDFRVQEEKRKEFLREIVSQESVCPEDEAVLEEDRKALFEGRKKRLEEKIRNEIYNYQPLDFSTPESALLYMMARLTPDFAALMKVFHQLRCALPTFMPTTMLDFGSGVGSATWAVDQTWPKSCKEVVNVDPSNAMHELHDVLLRGGLASLPLPRRKNSTSFRHFLPLTGSLKHDLVVCSRTLFEIGSRDMRLRTLDILWKTVMPGGCLVLVEGGRASGCHLTLEARDFLMQGLKVDTSSSRLRGRIIAPCPHQNACPLLAKQPKYRICTDSQLYQEVEYPDPLLEVFSYLIVQKPKELETREDALITWPRIIQPVIKSDSVIVRVCNKFGHLQELCASKGKHGTLCRQVARKSTLGDLYPVELLPPSQHINPGYNAIDLCHNKKARDDDKF